MKKWKRTPISNKICLGFRRILEHRDVILAIDEDGVIEAALAYIENVTQWYWTMHPHKKPRKKNK